MSIEIYVQSTPNPNAFKFILNKYAKNSGKATFHNAKEAEGVPLAQKLLEVNEVTQVHLFENVISVTQSGEGEWDNIEAQIRMILEEGMESHDPDFKTEEDTKVSSAPASSELAQIEEILDRTIRPGLQGDGGDLDVVNYEKDKHILTVNYMGACGSCPSSTAGTLQAIQGILREEFHPELQVLTV